MLMKALKMDNCVLWRVVHDVLWQGTELLQLMMELTRLTTPLQGEFFSLSYCLWCYHNDEYTYLLWYWWKIKMRIWDWNHKIWLLKKWQIIGIVWLTMCLFRSSVVSCDVSDPWSGTAHAKARLVYPPCIKPVAWYFHYHAMTHKG